MSMFPFHVVVVGNSHKKKAGFTLAELLIALGILGIIATFTIPKVLSSQQSQQKNAITKEIFSTVAAAYQKYSSENTVTSGTSMGDLTPYINYAALETSSTVVDWPQGLTYPCSSGTCIKMHNGARLIYTGVSFGGTTSQNALWFVVDPDSTLNSSGATYGFIYTNGRLTTHDKITPGTISSDATRNGCGSCDPSWFSW